MATDRRIVRTQATLQHALVSLIMERGYDAITVQDICEAANIGRSTFYAHYGDKAALKRSGLNHLKASLRVANPDRFGFILTLFEHGRDHLQLYRALVGSPGATTSLESLRRILAELIDDEVRATGLGGIQRTVTTEFMTGAILAVLTGWLDEGAVTPVTDMASHCQRLIEKSLD